MKRNFHFRLVALLILFIATGIAIVAQGNNLALTTTNLNARSGPGVNFDVISQFPHATTVSVTARNDVSDWLYVRAVDTGVEAWVSRTYLNLPDSLDVLSLPVLSADDTRPEGPPASNEVAPSGSGLGITISQINVRVGAGQENEAIDQLPRGVQVAIESRNRFGDWIIVRTIDGVIRGWVASRFVNFGEGVALEALPVSTEIIGALPSEQALSDFNPVITLPDGSTNELVQNLNNTPIFHNFRTARVRAIFRLGQEYGNRPNVFMKVGDSVTDTQPFMLAYGQGGGYNLGGYGYLQDTINHFAGVSPRDGVANSFTNRSFAAINGATSASMLDGLWADPAYCAGDSPLMCEINLTRPSVGLVLFGTQDMRVLQPFEFRIHLSSIVEAMMFNGVIPVLSTFHSNPAYYVDDALIFNNIILDVSNDYDVPLINLWKATQPLPDNGVNLADPVHLTQGIDNYYNFTGEENLYGVNMRNLLSLQALDELLKNTLSIP